jgi:hypothetical protein
VYLKPDGRVWTALNFSIQCSVVGFCENSDECLGSIIDIGIFEYPNRYFFLRKNLIHAFSLLVVQLHLSTFYYDMHFTRFDDLFN